MSSSNTLYKVEGIENDHLAAMLWNFIKGGFFDAYEVKRASIGVDWYKRFEASGNGVTFGAIRPEFESRLNDSREGLCDLEELTLELTPSFAQAEAAHFSVDEYAFLRNVPWIIMTCEGYPNVSFSFNRKIKDAVVSSVALQRGQAFADDLYIRFAKYIDKTFDELMAQLPKD